MGTLKGILRVSIDIKQLPGVFQDIPSLIYQQLSPGSGYESRASTPYRLTVKAIPIENNPAPLQKRRGKLAIFIRLQNAIQKKVH